MTEKEYNFIKKINDENEHYDWGSFPDDSEEYRKINFPSNFDSIGSIYETDMSRDFSFIIGTYRSRYYYEIDSYNIEIEYFAALFSKKRNGFIQIFFITNQMFSNYIMLEFPFDSKKQKERNIIESLYNLVNKKVNQVDDFLDEFLNN